MDVQVYVFLGGAFRQGVGGRTEDFPVADVNVQRWEADQVPVYRLARGLVRFLGT